MFVKHIQKHPEIESVFEEGRTPHLLPLFLVFPQSMRYDLHNFLEDVGQNADGEG